MWPIPLIRNAGKGRLVGGGRALCTAEDGAGRQSKFSIERLLKSLSSSGTQVIGAHKLNPIGWSVWKLRAWADRTRRDADLIGQRFVQRRLDVLGNDLAAAHFIVFRGGKVRLNTTPSDSWIELSEGSDECPPGLPKKYMKGVYLQAIEAAGMPLRYEGLVNLEGLSRLEWASFAGCRYIDDWCVDRMSRIFGDRLRHLDLSGCPLLTDRSLAPLYRFADLRTLVLDDLTDGKPVFQLASLLLEQQMPNLNVVGVRHIRLDSLES